MNDEVVKKVFIMDKEIVQVVFDFYLEIVDVDIGNNYYLLCIQLNCFEMFKCQGISCWGGGENLMQCVCWVKEKEEGMN